MSIPFSRPPHLEGMARGASAHAPNAALLIDFDNVTMGMRSDLSKELRTLLNSEIIKGKVAVQRAYADWRRYPQYIVPLSENSVDLIFAPAYGSSKKNATDIRMAIDGIELVFTRPEIGTFILLTGDSDFSSLVLKLKEYGKYVIGVGIQESSSDLLVQNCDEYYSYTALTGLRRAGDGPAEAAPGKRMDPWELVSRSLEQMVRRRDVMRSDRLKQVMIELDPGFDEGEIGYAKFSRFLSEAEKRGAVRLTKLDNGQYEVGPAKGSQIREEPPSASGPEAGSGGSSRGRGRGRRGEEASASPPPVLLAPTTPLPALPAPAVSAPTGSATPPAVGEALKLLRRAISELAGEDRTRRVRDSDVKRRMIAIDGSFREDSYGFSKFSRFLQHAAGAGAVHLHPTDGGAVEVSLGEVEPGTASETRPAPVGGEAPAAASDAGPVVAGGSPTPPEAAPASSEEAMVNRMTGWKGVGKKTAETLVSLFGEGLFSTIRRDPKKIRDTIPVARAEAVIEGLTREESSVGPAPVGSLESGAPAVVPAEVESPAIEEAEGMAPARSDESPAPAAGPQGDSESAPEAVSRPRRPRRGGRGARGEDASRAPASPEPGTAESGTTQPGTPEPQTAPEVPTGAESEAVAGPSKGRGRGGRGRAASSQRSDRGDQGTPTPEASAPEPPVGAEGSKAAEGSKRGGARRGAGAGRSGRTGKGGAEPAAEPVKQAGSSTASGSSQQPAPSPAAPTPSDRREGTAAEPPVAGRLGARRGSKAPPRRPRTEGPEGV